MPADAQRPARHSAVVGTVVGALTVLVLTIAGSVVALPSADRVLAEGLFADDAFYYFEIARNVAAGEGFTFDTINSTNGFQVLWLLLLVPVAMVVDDPDRFVTVVWWLQVLLGAVTASLAFVLARTLGPRTRTWIPTAIVMAALPFLPLWNGGMVNGLETPAFTVAVLASLLLLQRFLQDPAPKTAWPLAVGLTLTFLGRLDGLLLVVLVAVLITARRVGTWADRARVLALPAVVAVAYFAVNLVAFGSLSPVSGATKTIWGQRALEAVVAEGGTEWRLRLGNLAWPREYLDPILGALPESGAASLVVDVLVVAVILVAYVAIAGYYWRRGIPVLALFQAFLLGKFLVYGVLQFGYANYTWYWTLDVVGLALLVAVVTQGLLARRERRATVGAVAVIAVFLAAGFVGNWLIERGREWLAPDPRTGEIAEYAGSKYAAETIDASPLTASLLLSSADAGILGFYLDGPLVNLDGLVNGRERLESTRLHGRDWLPYVLDHPEFDGYVNWVRESVTASTLTRMERAGFVEVPDFADCVADREGEVRNDRGLLRLFLRPEAAAAWTCPTDSIPGRQKTGPE
jgi:hypothetical protein